VAGTVSTDSTIRIRVDAVGADTALAGIQRLVEEAQESQSRAQALADRFAALLFYVAAASGAVTFVVWTVLGRTDEAVERTVTVLVIACPHALGLAIPLTISVSTGIAARAGILVRNRLALERMRTVDAVLFDKTGTLTSGDHAVTGIVADEMTDDELLALAAAVEADSEHPLARAIVRAASEGVSPYRPQRGSVRSRAAVSKPTSMVVVWQLAARHYYANGSSPSPMRSRVAPKSRVRGVRPFSTLCVTSASWARSRSRIRSDRSPGPRSMRCTGWACGS
jgi:P-type E1-E2 ATPase